MDSYRLPHTRSNRLRLGQIWTVAAILQTGGLLALFWLLVDLTLYHEVHALHEYAAAGVSSVLGFLGLERYHYLSRLPSDTLSAFFKGEDTRFEETARSRAEAELGKNYEHNYKFKSDDASLR